MSTNIIPQNTEFSDEKQTTTWFDEFWSDFDESVIPPEEGGMSVETWPSDSTFGKSAERLHRMGFNVIPGDKNKKPMETWKDWQTCHIPPEQLASWVFEHPDATPLLLTGYHRDGGGLAVNDADSPLMFPWIESNYPSDYTVETGRDGGGRHYWNWVSEGVKVSGRNGMVGPDEGIDWSYTITEDGKIDKSSKWGRTKIDVKANGNYVVAPGAIHKSGRTYMPSWDMSGDPEADFVVLKAGLPVFNNDLYEQHVKEATARRAEHQQEINAALQKWKAENHKKAPEKEGSRQNVDVVPMDAEHTIEEPFIQWCQENPSQVNLLTWFGLATNLAAVYGEEGRSEFHRISALDKSKYKADEADKTFTKAMTSSPTGYQNLVDNGYTGPVPDGYKNPALFLRAMAKKASAPKWIKIIKLKDGREKPDPDSIDNFKAMLDFHHIEMAYNRMKHSVEITIRGKRIGENHENTSLSVIRNLCRTYGLTLSAIDDHINIITQKNEYHPVEQWIKSKPWDGTDRIQNLLASLTIDPGFDTDLAKTLLSTWLVTGAAAVTRCNGIAAQGLLVLQGPQSAGKTRWFMSLCPDGTWCKDGMLVDPANRDSIQKATAHWIVELGELDATFRKADVSRLKSFITERTDVYRSAYARREVAYPRRTLFAGSVNPATFLVDNTGNRRFWTIPVTKCNPKHGIDLQQLWAQSLQLLQDGHPTWLSDDVLDKLNGTNRQFENIDPLEAIFDELFIFDKDGRTSQTEMMTAIRNSGGGMNQTDTRRLLSILRERLHRQGLKEKKSDGTNYWPVKNRADIFVGISADVLDE